MSYGGRDNFLPKIKREFCIMHHCTFGPYIYFFFRGWWGPVLNYILNPILKHGLKLNLIISLVLNLNPKLIKSYEFKPSTFFKLHNLF